MNVPLYERIWIILMIIVMVVFIGVLSFNAFALGRHPPGHAELIRPEDVFTDPRTSPTGVLEVAPGKYEVRMAAFTFAFEPSEVHVPAGAEVTFVLATTDVIHGFEVAGTNVNAMVIPGRITRVTGRFDKPGEYLIICHEYCGIGHHFMAATLEVGEEE